MAVVEFLEFLDIVEFLEVLDIVIVLHTKALRRAGGS